MCREIELVFRSWTTAVRVAGGGEAATVDNPLQDDDGSDDDERSKKQGGKKKSGKKKSGKKKG